MAGTTYAFPVQGYQGKVEKHWGSEAGGSDIFAPAGTPVLAVAGGRVLDTSYSSLGGYNVTIQSTDGRQYYYAHLQGQPAVQPGQNVPAGALLGAVGNSGNAEGTPSHLHIGIGKGIQTGGGAAGGVGTGFDAVNFLNNINQASGKPPGQAAPERSGGQMSSSKAAQYLPLVKKYFPPDQWGNALAVLEAESTANPNAHNTTGEDSRGLFQINVGPGANTGYASRNLFDPETNVRTAAEIYQRSGWQPWTTAVQLGIASGQTHYPAPTGGGSVDENENLTDEEIDALLGGMSGGGSDGEDESESVDYWRQRMTEAEARVKAAQAAYDKLQPEDRQMSDEEDELKAAIAQRDGYRKSLDTAIRSQPKPKAQPKPTYFTGPDGRRYQIDPATGQAMPVEGSPARADAGAKYTQMGGKLYQQQPDGSWQVAIDPKDELDDWIKQTQVQIQQGQLDLSAANSAFDQRMANYTFKNQRQQMAGNLFDQANARALQGAPYAVDPTKPFLPGFAPGKGTPIGEIGRLLGVNLEGVPSIPIAFDPRGDAQRVLTGGYDWPDIAPTVSGQYNGLPSLPGPAGKDKQQIKTGGGNGQGANPYLPNDLNTWNGRDWPVLPGAPGMGDVKTADDYQRASVGMGDVQRADQGARRPLPPLPTPGDLTYSTQGPPGPTNLNDPSQWHSAQQPPLSKPATILPPPQNYTYEPSPSALPSPSNIVNDIWKYLRGAPPVLPGFGASMR